MRTGRRLLIAGSAIAAVVALARRLGRGMRWYQMVYRTIYRLGVIFWQRQGPAKDLVALVEGPDALPVGRALDLGCGTGMDTVYLAKHGWEVTAVEMVPQALAAARRRAAAEGVAPRFVEGDVTRLHDFGVGTGYDLVVDFGCFHTLPDDQRDAYVGEVSEAAAPGATLLLYGFRMAPRVAPLHAGVTPEEIGRRFGEHGWALDRADRALAADTGNAARREPPFDFWRFQLHREPVAP